MSLPLHLRRVLGVKRPAPSSSTREGKVVYVALGNPLPPPTPSAPPGKQEP